MGPSPRGRGHPEPPSAALGLGTGHRAGIQPLHPAGTPVETPEMRLLPWETRRRELSLERARRQREGDLCWGQALPPVGCGKVRSGVGPGCRGLGAGGGRVFRQLSTRERS